MTLPTPYPLYKMSEKFVFQIKLSFSYYYVTITFSAFCIKELQKGVDLSEITACSINSLHDLVAKSQPAPFPQLSSWALKEIYFVHYLQKL